MLGCPDHGPGSANMKHSLLLLLAAVAGLAAGKIDPALRGPHGAYVEARSATVWGGGCHINAEIVTQERQAIVGYAFEGGTSEGVELSGVRLVAALEAESPLSESGPENGVVWVSGPSSEACAAAVGWALAGLGLEAGSVDVLRGAVDVDHGALLLSVEGHLQVEGDPVPDAACCTMPEARWYVPLDGRVGESRVGMAETCRLVQAEGLTPWSSTGTNSLQFGRFGVER